ncbi:unnamed protein product [Sphagnum balticum]
MRGGNQSYGRGEGDKSFNASTVKPYNLAEVEGTTLEDRKYCIRVQVMEKPLQEFTTAVFESIVAEANNNYNMDVEDIQPDISAATSSESLPFAQGHTKNEYTIEYIPAKGLLCVKYVTNIELNIENTDLVMFQCNNIAYNWSNVTMELV